MAWARWAIKSELRVILFCFFSDYIDAILSPRWRAWIDKHHMFSTARKSTYWLRSVATRGQGEEGEGGWREDRQCGVQTVDA